ncbi:MAG: flippase [Patescibacteria group bacterium]
MSQVRAIAHNTMWQLGGKTVSTLLGLIAIAIMTRALGVEQFGWYSTAIGFLQFIGIFTDFGFTVITSSMLAEPAHDKSKLLSNLFTWRIITAVLTQGIAPLTIFLFPYPAPIKWAAVIMSFSFIGVSLNQVLVAYYQTKLKMHIQAMGEVIGRVVLVAGLALVATGHLGFLPMMAVITLGSLSYTAYLWYKSEPIHFQIDRAISKSIFKKLWPVALSVIFNCFYLQGDRVILPLFVSQTEVGLYGAAYRVIDICIQVSSMLMGMFLPLIAFAWSRGLKDDFKMQVQRGFDLMSLFIIPMVAGVLALATPIMRFVASDKFIGSGAYLRVQILTMLGILFGTVFGHVNLALGKQKKSLWIYLANAILAVVAYFIFIPMLGGFGAAWVRVGSETFAGLGLLIMAGCYSGFWPRPFAFLKICLASAIMAFVIIKLQLGLFVSIIIGVIIYTVLVLALRVISKQTLREILPALKK